MPLFTTSEEYIAYMKSPQRTFLQVIPDAQCPLIKKIHPRKQQSVENIYRLARDKYPDVFRRIIIFGSAITWECWYGSDLDICLDWNPEVYREIDGFHKGRALDAILDIGDAIEGERDILNYREDDDSLVFREIREKGLVIYEQHVR